MLGVQIFCSLTSVTSPAGTFTYAYTPGSSLIASVNTFPLPLGEGQGEGAQLTVTNTWEANRDVLDVKDNGIPSTTPPISSFNYGVNNIGQRTGVVTTGLAFDTSPGGWVWGYDALGQIISADSPNSTFDRAYTYDQIGNRKKSADGTLETTGISALVYEPNELNQYDAIGAFSPIYDADGNQKDAQILPLGSSSLVSCVYHWDAENRLVAVNDTNGADIVTYSYDSQSRRVARVQGSSVTLYLYDDWNCLAEYTLHNSSFNLHTSLSWGIDLSGSLQGAGGVGGLLSLTKHEAQSTVSYFPTYDGNGNVSEYLTASGAIAAHYEYDPFGRTIVATGDNAAEFAYRFSTKPVDPATGLYYYGYRWFDPSKGRWSNRDPIDESGGLNLYGFVGNDGSNGVDPLGLDRFDLGRHKTAVENRIKVATDQTDWISAFKAKKSVSATLTSQMLQETSYSRGYALKGDFVLLPGAGIAVNGDYKVTTTLSLSRSIGSSTELSADYATFRKYRKWITYESEWDLYMVVTFPASLGADGANASCDKGDVLLEGPGSLTKSVGERWNLPDYNSFCQYAVCGKVSSRRMMMGGLKEEHWLPEDIYRLEKDGRVLSGETSKMQNLIERIEVDWSTSFRTFLETL